MRPIYDLMASSINKIVAIGMRQVLVLFRKGNYILKKLIVWNGYAVTTNSERFFSSFTSKHAHIACKVWRRVNFEKWPSQMAAKMMRFNA